MNCKVNLRQDGGIVFSPQRLRFPEELAEWHEGRFGLWRNSYYETRDDIAMTFLNNEELEFEEVDRSALIDGEVMVLLRIRKKA